MSKTFFFFLFIMILLAVVVYGVKPTAQLFTGDVGLELRIPQAEFIKQFEDAQLGIHVFNKSNGILMTSDGTSCDIHLYNKTGYHIFSQSMGFLDTDFLVNISGTNFSTLGIMPFVIWCNTSNVGGFVSSSIEVTADGEDDTVIDNTAGISVMVFVLLIALFFFIIPLKEQLSENVVLNHILKRCSILMGIFLMSLNTAIVSTIADSANLGVLQELFRYLWIINWSAYLAMFILGYSTITTTIRLMQKRAEMKRAGEYD